jgi:hypothetical protein
MKKSIILLSAVVAMTLPVITSAVGLLNYKPPLSGAPVDRVGGGTRGKLVVPKIQVLAPEEIALTSKEQPVFYWYVAENKAQIVEFTLTKDGETEPLLKKTFSITDKGLQSLKLAEVDVPLEADANYRWSVKISSETTSEIVSHAMIRYQLPVVPLETTEQKAENGYWYDVMQELLESHSPLANDLLKQIGLRVPTL